VVRSMRYGGLGTPALRFPLRSCSIAGLRRRWLCCRVCHLAVKLTGKSLLVAAATPQPTPPPPSAARSREEQAARFRHEAQRLIDSGELNPAMGDLALDQITRRAGERKRPDSTDSEESG